MVIVILHEIRTSVWQICIESHFHFLDQADVYLSDFQMEAAYITTLHSFHYLVDTGSSPEYQLVLSNVKDKFKEFSYLVTLFTYIIQIMLLVRCSNNGLLQKVQKVWLQKAQVVNLAFPIIAVAIGAAALSSAGWNIYQTHQSTKKSDEIFDYSKSFQESFYNENSRYWQDYIDRHHLGKRQIKYPYRTGYNFNRTGIMSADAGLYNNELSRYGSYFRAGSTALGMAGLYRSPTSYKSNPNYTDIMYG